MGSLVLGLEVYDEHHLDDERVGCDASHHDHDPPGGGGNYHHHHHHHHHHDHKQVVVETFPLRLADDSWHRLAVMVSGDQIEVKTVIFITIVIITITLLEG